MNFSGLFQNYGWELAIITLLLTFLSPLVFLIISLLRFLISLRFPIEKTKIQGRHILIIGASQGLGLDFALQVSNLGAKRITLVARGSDQDEHQKSRLDYALEACQDAAPPETLINSLKLDIFDSQAVKVAMEELLVKTGRVDWVVICSGSALPQMIATDLEKCNPDNEINMMNVNYFGSVNVIRSLLVVGGSQRSPVFPERIATVGSVATACPMAGFAAYGASKAAIRIFTDSLRNERFFYGNVKVHHFMPGSMDTPGFEEENKRKPKVTRSIEGTADLYSASQAAKAFLTGITSEIYLINNDPLGFLARCNVQSLTPRNWAILDFLSAPLAVLMGEAFCYHFDYVSHTCALEDLQQTTS